MRLNSQPVALKVKSKIGSHNRSFCAARLSGLTVAICLSHMQTAAAAESVLPTLIPAATNAEQARLLENILLTNTAGAAFNRGAQASNVMSNTVTVELQRPRLFYAIELTTPPIKIISDQKQSQLVEWRNTLTNNSNTSATISLESSLPAALSELKIYQDNNNNGVIDAGDTLLPETIVLPHDTSINLIVQAKVKPTLGNGATAQLGLKAVVAEDNKVIATATDSLLVLAPLIQFTEPTFTTKQPTSQVGKDVFVTTTYAQCNYRADAVDYAWVKVTSELTKDSYALKAVETGNNTGKYRLLAPTQNNANALNDQIIQTLDKDTLTATLVACVAPTVAPNQTPTTNDLVSVSDPLSTTIAITDTAPSLQVTKEGDVKVAELGDYVNYTITIKNTGAATAYNVNLKDALPQGFSLIEDSVRIAGAKTTQRFTNEGKYKVLGIGELATDETATIRYRVLVGSTALGGNGINRAIATANDSDIDSNNTPITSREAQWQVEVSQGLLNTDGIVVGKVYNDINRDGIQQKQAGELGVPGVRLYMENGNFAVTDSEGKYNFYGVTAKTHVIKIDRITLPAHVELIEQGNRNAGDPSSRFVDLKYGELHRADFGIADGLGDTSPELVAELIARRNRVQGENNALEQAIKSELSLEQDASATLSGSYRSDEAAGCKQDGNNTTSGNCEQATVYSVRDQRAAPLTLPALPPVAAPKMEDLESYLQNTTDNSSRFINLTSGQILPSRQVTAQIAANLAYEVKLFANGRLVPASRIGKTGRLESAQLIGFDYFGIPLEAGNNTLTIKAYDANEQEVDSTSITVIAPGDIKTVTTQIDTPIIEADGVSKIYAQVTLRDAQGTPVANDTLITVDSNVGTIVNKDLNPDLPGVQLMVTDAQVLVEILSPQTPGKGTLKITANGIESAQTIQFIPSLRPLIAVGIIEGSISLKDFDSKQVSADQGIFEKELQEFAGNDDLAANGRAALFLKGKVRGDYLLTLSYDSDKKGERLFRDIRPDDYYPVYGDASAKGFDAQSTSKLYIRLDKGRSFAMYGDLNTQTTNDEGLQLGNYSRSLTGVKAQFEDDNTRITTFAAQTSSSQSVNETRGLGISGPYPLAENFNDILENSESVEVLVRDADNPGIIVSRQSLTRFADYEIDPISRSLYLKSPIPSQDFNGKPVYLRVIVEVETGGERYWVGGISAKQQVNKQTSIGGSYVKSDDPLNTEELASVNTVIKLNDRTKLIAEYAHNKASDPNYQAANQINTDELTANDVSGNALRLNLSYDDHSRTKAEAYYNKADAGFVTAGSTITAGRTETGVSLDYRLDTAVNTTLKLDGVRTQEDSTNAKQEGFKAAIERLLTPNLAAELGVRYYSKEGAASRNIQGAVDVTGLGSNTDFNDATLNQSALSTVGNADQDIQGTTVNAKLTARLPKLNKSLVFAEYEQDISHSERNAISIGGETALGNLGRLYARHDLINSLSGSYGLDDTAERQRTVVGVDATYMKDGQVYSEYRMSDAISARDTEAALGLRNKWHVRQGLTLNTLFERVQSLDDTAENQSTAVGVGAEYLAQEGYKVSGRLEKRWGDSSDTLLATAGLAYRYSDDVTLLAKDIYSNTSFAEGERTINRLQLGAAYRDLDSNQLDMLSKLEYRLDDNQTGNDAYEKEALIWSLHGNYHPTRPLTLSGHYAGKYLQYDADGTSDNNTAHAAYVRGLYDISERWDAGLQAGSYWNGADNSMTYMLGAEVGYSPMTNLWLSVGYNFMGFNDEDIASDDTTQQGAYVRLRFKFDEDLFKSHNPNDPK